MAATQSTGIRSNVKHPAILDLSHVATLNDRWDVLADAQWTQWTQWSTIRTLRLMRDNGTTLQSTPENFNDTGKFGIATRDRCHSAWTLRSGVAFGQSPVPAAGRRPHAASVRRQPRPARARGRNIASATT